MYFVPLSHPGLEAFAMLPILCSLQLMLQECSLPDVVESIYEPQCNES